MSTLEADDYVRPAEVEREGMISPGDVDWFPAEHFRADSYLWGFEASVWLSLIISTQPGKGNLSRLFDAILEGGRTVKVPTPFPHMQAILERKGFVQIPDPNCDVWAKVPARVRLVREVA